jgi:transcriptional regulator with XRE-family HTH domain
MPEDAVTNRAGKRQRLAQRRKAVGLTQEQLAGQLGVERTTVVRWERGETQPLPWLRPKLAKALGVSADRLEELLATDGAPASPQGRTAAVPKQPPAAIADFTGRAAGLEALTRMPDQAGAGAPGAEVISAIGGTRPETAGRMREGTGPPWSLRSRAAWAALAAAALAVAAIAVLIASAVSGTSHLTSPAAATGQWQCGPFMRATLWQGSGVDQRLQACIASDHGHLDLKGVLTGSVNAWKEQIILVLKHPRQPTYEKLISPVCTTSTCIYQVAVNPGYGSWWVIPQWERSDGGYQSTGQPSPPVTY